MSRVNDFAFKIGTVNGTGSASANGLLMQAIFRMGIPVTGKNLFPSNIQGLPTWYEIRVNKDGYTARTPHFDLMRRAQRRDLRERRRRSALRRLPAVRLVLAARRQARAARRHLPRHSVGRDVQGRVQGRARAHPDEEHRLRRRAGGAARDRHGDRRQADQGEVRGEEGAARLERQGDRARLRLREGELRLPAAVPSREDGRDEGQHPDRRQHGRGARRGVRRRDGRRVVSDHAVDVADGSVQGLLQKFRLDPETEAEEATRSCRRKTSWRRWHGDRRRRGPARARSRRRRARASR